MSDLYPFESHYLDLDGLRYHYLDEGPRQAPTVVMLHGNPTWSFFYRDVVSALSATHRCIVPDHIGMGLSDKPPDSQYAYTLSRRVSDLETLLDHVGARDDLTLILHDWGGMIGMAYAVDHPARIGRLVVLNTAAFHMPDGKRIPLSLWLCRNTRLGAFLVRRFNAFARGAARYAVAAGRLPPDVRRAYLRPYDSWANRIATVRFVQDVPLKPGDRTFDQVSAVESKLGLFRDTPTLVCWGKKDFVFDDPFLRQWRIFFPHARVHTFHDAGHYLLEDAGDRVIPLIREFISARPSAASKERQET